MFPRLLSCRSGVVSVEAAIVFPVLIALALGIMEFGLMIFTFSSMQTAAREVTRQMSVNFTTQAAAEAAVRARLPAWSADAASIVVTQTAPATPQVNVITIEVTMPATEATPVTFFTNMADAWTLRTEVIMKQELPL